MLDVINDQPTVWESNQLDLTLLIQLPDSIALYFYMPLFYNLQRVD